MFKSLILDYCWCCEARTGLHNHHVIPQAYGGKDGPQVTVCGGCHTTVHTAGLKSPPEWDQMLPVKKRDRFLILTQIIYNARTATKGNTNKPLKMQHEFTVERSKKVRALKQLLGVSSLSSVIDACVDRIHSQLTPVDNKRE